MSKNKYNFTTMKAEYFSSEELNLNIWLKQTYNKDTSKCRALADGMRGRKKEKLKYLEKLKDKALKQGEKDFVKRYKPDVEMLDRMHKNTMAILGKLQVDVSKIDLNGAGEEHLKKLEQMARIIDRASGSVERIWGIIKTEKGEPTKINKNYNNNTEVEPLTDEELEQINKLNELND